MDAPEEGAPFRGGPNLLLRAIDSVYLRYHDNAYHGWIWHWPYFDCGKAVELAERLRTVYPQAAEESLWTKIYCYRIQGLNGTKDVDSDESRKYASIAAQVRWKADPERVRALCRELIESYPRGKYAARASELLEQKDLLVELPTSWGQPVILIDRR